MVGGFGGCFESLAPDLEGYSYSSRTGYAIESMYQELQLQHQVLEVVTLQQSNIAMENGPFEDVFPIRIGDMSLLC